MKNKDMKKLTLIFLMFCFIAFVCWNKIHAMERTYEPITTIEATAEAAEPTESPQRDLPQETIPHIVLNTETPAQPRTVAQTTTIQEEKTEDSMKSLGTFRLTAYCSCEICCGKWAKYNKTYSGTTPKEGRTIAVDKNQIPIGSKVMIDGHVYIAEDTGSAIKENCIDIYHNSHKAAQVFGVQKKEVFLITE